MHIKHSQQGFTLVELLIALFVFSLLAAFAYRGVNTLLFAQHETTEESSSLKTVEKLFQLWAKDVRHYVKKKPPAAPITPVPLSGNSPNNSPITLLLDDQEVRFYTLTHGGADDTQAHLISVRYRLQDEVLWRETRPAYAETYRGFRLIQGIEDFAVTLLLAPGNNQEDTPQAIQLTLQHKQLGRLERVMSLPRGAKVPTP